MTCVCIVVGLVTSPRIVKKAASSASKARAHVAQATEKDKEAPAEG